MAEGPIERLVQMVARGSDPEGALARIQAGLLARSLGARGLGEARARAKRLGPSVESLLAHLDDRELGLIPAITDPDSLSRFYELLQGALRPQQRRALGQYFTPRPLVGLMWSLALEALRSQGLPASGVRVIDPAAGSGAFLTEALHRGIDGPQLLGVEILASAVRTAQVNTAVLAVQSSRSAPLVLEADAYAEATEATLLGHLRAGQSALIIGNPPYNGTSPLLKDPPRLASARERLLPFASHHAPHSGFRDDFAYFFGLAHRLLERSDKPGVICLITPSSLLEARDYLGLRAFLLERYRVQVVEVGEGAFPDARVATCITVLTPGQGPARSYSLPAERDRGIEILAREPSLAGLVPPLAPAPPDFALRSVRRFAELDTEVDPITDVLQRWFTPHKTGFDELLVDADSDALWSRLRELVAPRLGAKALAQRWGQRFASPRVLAKLEATRRWALQQRGFPARRRLLPYLRYNPHSAQLVAPKEQWQHVYFEPRIATLFNHAFKGTLGRFHPHARKPQLLFNTFESPLYAMVVERPGVLHLYQHARFAPLHVPEGCYAARGQSGAEGQDRGRWVLNFTPAWQERVARLREPADALWLLAGIYASAPIQRVFGPEQGKRAAVPIKRFDARLAPIAQRIADRARVLAALEARGAERSELQRGLDLDVLRLYVGQDALDGALPSWALTRASLG